MKRSLILIGIAIMAIITFWFLFVFSGGSDEQLPGYTNLPGTDPELPSEFGGSSNDQLEQTSNSSDKGPVGTRTMPLETDAGIVYVNDIPSLPNTKQLSAYSYELGPFALDDFDPEFNIVFYEQNESFAISLRRDPLSQNRREVETYLQQQLGISRSEMCELSVYLGTSVDFDPFYGGKDLGFSFCPGSVQLE